MIWRTGALRLKRKIMKPKNYKNYRAQEDREKSIQDAISMASPGDVVLIAGKGHEDYQIIGTEKIHFSDVEIAQKYLKDSP